jgi:hypothetical protein
MTGITGTTHGDWSKDHAAYLLYVSMSARIGEIFESSAHPGTGRGLLYQVSCCPLGRVDMRIRYRLNASEQEIDFFCQI